MADREAELLRSLAVARGERPPDLPLPAPPVPETITPVREAQPALPEPKPMSPARYLDVD
jgi:hypothetical protein